MKAHRKLNLINTIQEGRVPIVFFSFNSSLYKWSDFIFQCVISQQRTGSVYCVYSHASTKAQSEWGGLLHHLIMAMLMRDLLHCPILSSLCAAMPNSLSLSLSPTTTHYNAPFHTHAHLLLLPSPVRADACHGSSDVSCLQSCRSRCSAAALPAGLM